MTVLYSWGQFGGHAGLEVPRHKIPGRHSGSADSCLSGGGRTW